MRPRALPASRTAPALRTASRTNPLGPWRSRPSPSELLPTWGGHRLRREGRLPLSGSPGYRIGRSHGLGPPSRRQDRPRRARRAIYKRFAPLAKLQQEVKDLEDLPQYWPQMRRLGLPPHQLTCREIRTGAPVFASADEHPMTNSQIFPASVAEPLKQDGVPREALPLPTDHGSEHIGSWQKKTPRAFTRQVEGHDGMTPERIPPHGSTSHSDVESFHHLIEREFYDIETFENPQEFLAKASASPLSFNDQRPNAWREGKTPSPLLREGAPPLSPKVFARPPGMGDDVLRPPALGESPQEALPRDRAS